MNDDIDQVKRLNELLGIAKDVIKICRSVVASMHDPMIEAALTELADRYDTAAAALRSDVVRLGHEPRAAGTLTGSARTLVAEVRSVATPQDGSAPLADVLAVHARWLECADEVLAEPLPMEVRNLLILHRRVLQVAADRVAVYG